MYASCAEANFSTASGVILQAVGPAQPVCSSVIPRAVEASFRAASMMTRISSSVNTSTDDGSGWSLMNYTCQYSTGQIGIRAAYDEWDIPITGERELSGYTRPSLSFVTTKVGQKIY